MNMKNYVRLSVLGGTVMLFAFVNVILWDRSDASFSEIYGYKNVRGTIRDVAYAVFYIVGHKKEPGYTAEAEPFIRYFEERVDEQGLRHIEEIEKLPYGLRGDIFQTLPLVSLGHDTFILRRFTEQGNQQKFFYNSQVYQNPLNILRLLAANIKHGVSDDDLTFSEAQDVLGFRHLSMTCARTTEFVLTVLSEMGIKSRIGTSLTLDGWNSYDNGHTFLEVYFPVFGKWGIVDVDTNRYFMLENGMPASVLDVSVLGIEAIIIKRLSDDPFLDYSGYASFQFFGEYVERNLMNWYLRVMQAFGIYDSRSRKYIFKVDHVSEKNRIESYSPAYEAVGHEVFIRRFYEAQ